MNGYRGSPFTLHSSLITAHCSLIDEIDDRHLRWRENPHGRPPGPRATAGVELRPVLQVVEPVLHGIGDPCEESEWEDLTAVSVACLTVYDMVKAVDRSMTIEGVQVLDKTGGTHGDWRRA